MKILLVTPEPIDAQAVRSAVGEGVDQAEVLVVVPSTESSGVRFWVSDVDDAIADAEATQAQVVEQLAAQGGETGEEAAKWQALEAFGGSTSTTDEGSRFVLRITTR